MNLFRRGSTSVPVDHQHWDEALTITQDDTITVSTVGDASPPPRSRPIEDPFDIDAKNEERIFMEETRKSSKMALQMGKHVVDKSKIEKQEDDSAERKLKIKKQEDLHHSKYLSPEIRTLFESIEDYKPQLHKIKTELKCFIPDFIPATGEPDSFVKIPRPDGISNGLGLRIIDEPGLIQSDVPVLDLQLKAMMRKRRAISGADNAVQTIENMSKNPQEIDKWIASVQDLRRLKLAPELSYMTEMTYADDFMESFSIELIQALETDLEGCLDPDLDLSLQQYAILICSLLDLPLKKNKDNKTLVHGMHFLFSHYLEQNDLLLNNDTISVL